MKALIFLIAMLFTTVSAASYYPDLPTEALQTFIEQNIDFGLDADQLVFRGYVDSIYEHGTPIQNMRVAIQFAHCSIMWRQVLEIIPGSSILSHAQVESGIWRAIITAKLHVERAEGMPERVETYMIPLLAELEKAQNQQPGAGKTDVTASNIYTCTALDVTTFNALKEQGQSPWAPPEWTLEPIPPLPEDAFDEPKTPNAPIDVKPGQIISKII